MRGEVSARIREHILSLSEEWTVEDLIDALPGTARDAITSVINNMLVRDMVNRVDTRKSRSGGFVAVYEVIDLGESATTRLDNPAVWAGLMRGQRYEDIKLKRRP